MDNCSGTKQILSLMDEIRSNLASFKIMLTEIKAKGSSCNEFAPLIKEIALWASDAEALILKPKRSMWNSYIGKKMKGEPTLADLGACCAEVTLEIDPKFKFLSECSASKEFSSFGSRVGEAMNVLNTLIKDNSIFEELRTMTKQDIAAIVSERLRKAKKFIQEEDKHSATMTELKERDMMKQEKRRIEKEYENADIASELCKKLSTDDSFAQFVGDNFNGSRAAASNFIRDQLIKDPDSLQFYSTQMHKENFASNMLTLIARKVKKKTKNVDIEDQVVNIDANLRSELSNLIDDKEHVEPLKKDEPVDLSCKEHAECKKVEKAVELKDDKPEEKKEVKSSEKKDTANKEGSSTKKVGKKKSDKQSI